MQRFIAYYRVSTEQQGRSGLGLEAQRAAVLSYVGNDLLLGEHTDIESGKHAERPALKQALAEARKADATLVIAKLDRLARNVAFIANLMESGVRFVAVDMPQANPLTLHIMAAFAQHEREAISQRTKAALAAAKARGTKLGNPRPHCSLSKGQKTIKARADEFAQRIRPLIDKLLSDGSLSFRKLANALNQHEIKTVRGKNWTATAVRNLLLRSDMAEHDIQAYSR